MDARVIGERGDAVLRTAMPAHDEHKGCATMDQSAIDELATAFMRARRTGERLDALPARLAPKNFKDARAGMAAVDKLVGEPIVGTKIAAKPGAEVVYAPLPAGRVFNSPARVPRALTPCHYMECEISFRLTRDLPARVAEYTEAEVFDALEGCAAFELVDSRFKDLKSAMDNRPYEFYADHIANGAMVFGTFRNDWQKFDFTKTRVSMKQGGRTIIAKTGGHPTGNPAIPAVVLANLRRGTTGVKAGTFIVTGS